MRGIEWKRYQHDRILKKRLRELHSRWYCFTTENGDMIQNPIWSDFIGLKGFYFFLRRGTTNKWDTRYAVKYSPNKAKGYYRDRKPNKHNLSYGTREKDRVLFMKIINEYRNDRSNEFFTEQ